MLTSLWLWWQASIAFNGFGGRVELHRVAAGAVGAPQAICVERGGRHETDLARGYSTPEVHTDFDVDGLYVRGQCLRCVWPLQCKPADSVTAVGNVMTVRA